MPGGKTQQEPWKIIIIITIINCILYQVLSKDNILYINNLLFYWCDIKQSYFQLYMQHWYILIIFYYCSESDRIDKHKPNHSRYHRLVNISTWQHPEPAIEEHLWTNFVIRSCLRPKMQTRRLLLSIWRPSTSRIPNLRILQGRVFQARVMKSLPCFWSLLSLLPPTENAFPYHLKHVALVTAADKNEQALESLRDRKSVV